LIIDRLIISRKLTVCIQVLHHSVAVAASDNEWCSCRFGFNEQNRNDQRSRSCSWYHVVRLQLFRTDGLQGQLQIVHFLNSYHYICMKVKGLLNVCYSSLEMDNTAMSRLFILSVILSAVSSRALPISTTKTKAWNA